MTNKEKKQVTLQKKDGRTEKSLGNFKLVIKLDSAFHTPAY